MADTTVTSDKGIEAWQELDEALGVMDKALERGMPADASSMRWMIRVLREQHAVIEQQRKAMDSMDRVISSLANEIAADHRNEHGDDERRAAQGS